MVTVKNVLKAVLKVGLKAAVPFVGDILVAAVEEGVGLLIDHQSEQKARDLHGGKSRAAALLVSDSLQPIVYRVLLQACARSSSSRRA